MANKDTQNRINSLRQEEQLQRNLQTMLNERLTASGKLTKAQEELSQSLLETTDLEDKLLTIQAKKDEILKKYNGNQKELGKKLLEQLETMEEYLKIEKKRKDKADEIKDLIDGTRDSLLESVGLSSEMFKNGIKFGLGMMVAKKGAEMVSEAFKSTVGLAKDFYTKSGATAGEAAKIGASVAGASLSMTGLLYGAEAVAEAAHATADFYGSTESISSDMLKNVTELTAMMGDGAGAVRMNQILQQASGNAAEMTDEIKEIAHGAGVEASVVFKEMGANANLLVGKSKEEIALLAKKTAELRKHGASMELMNSVSENMLNIESSLKAEMKARAFGMDVNTAAIREAALAYQTGAGSAEELAQAVADQVGSAEEFGKMGPMQQKIFADSVGMSTQELTDMLIKQEGLVEAQEDSLHGIKEFGAQTATAFTAAMPLLAQTTGFMKNIGIDAAKALGPVKKLAMAGLSKLGIGGKGGAAGAAKTPEMPAADKGPNKFMESMSKIKMSDVLKGAAAMLVVAAAVFVFGKAIQEFMKVSWDAIGMAVVSMLALVGAVALLGMLMQGPVGVGLLLGAAAMLVVASAMWVLGKAIQELATGFGMMGALTENLTALVMIAPGLLALAGIFGILGLSLVGLSVGLAAVTLFLPTLLLLAATLPLISSALGMGGGDSGTAGGGGGNTADPLLEEIKGLRADIQSQPIVIKVNDKLVTEMSRANSRMETVRRQHR